MGYTTEFVGSFKLDKALKKEHKEYLAAFSASRRMGRDPKIAQELDDPYRIAVGLPIGDQGAYFVGKPKMTEDEDEEFVFMPDNDASVKDYNKEPRTQPSLWCQWTPNEEGTTIEWDGAEKFYEYIPWIQYIIDHFLTLWGYYLNGEVEWQGEDSSDFGKIVVKDNVVTTKKGRKSYE